jgi:enoyl-CoA hydratase
VSDAENGAQLVRLERRDDGVAVVRLDNAKLNTLSEELLAQLQRTATALIDDPPGAVVITGGDRVFAAGAEISEFLDRADDRPAPVRSSDQLSAYGRRFLEAFTAVAMIPRATIAAVHGFALGGGCELALACDFRMCADTARWGQPEILLGIIPGGGGTQRLTRLVGPAVAKDLIFSGRQVKADEALSIGLVDAVVDADDLLDAAIARATRLAAGAAAGQGLAKAAIDQGLDGSLADGLLLEQRLFAESFATDDAEIGINSFLENGPGQAEFTGR